MLDRSKEVADSVAAAWCVRVFVAAVHPRRRVPYNQSKCANAAAVAAAGAALLFLPSAVAADAAAALPFRSVPLRSFAQDLSDSFSRNCDA